MNVISTAITGAQSKLGDSETKRLYELLKADIQTRYGPTSELLQAILRVEAKPESEGRRLLLAEEVTACGADHDEALTRTSEALLERLNVRRGIGIDDKDWDLLLDRIEDGLCTPFVGAGINYGLLPLGGQIAGEWAKEYGYPLNDSDDLARVAQFMAVDHHDKMYPKDKMLKLLRSAGKPDFRVFDERTEGLKALAELPIPVYITINYDNLLLDALGSVPKLPKRELCRWTQALRRRSSVFESAEGFQATPANPVVFYLHGHESDRHSLVLTEDDYLDFLVSISRDQQALLPSRIQEALTDCSLLFIGYRMKDINFRVLYRGVVQSLAPGQRSLSVAVQVSPPDDHRGDPVAAQKYLTEYFGDLEVHVYWGTATMFTRELRDRWRRRHGGSAASASTSRTA